MKKKSKVLAVLMCGTMILAAGCGEKADTKEEKTDVEVSTEEEEQVSESDEYLALIQEAYDQYKAEAVHGSTGESTGTREDGSTDTSTWVHIIDKGQQRALNKSMWGDGWDSSSYYTKEGEDEYYYTEVTSYNEAGEESSKYFKILVTDEEGMAYSDQIEEEEGKQYESSKYYDITNVNVTSEGEEELEGVQVQKFKVEYDSQWKGNEKMTREALLAENEWTEEDVALLEGMSDAIDAYIEESNAQLKKDMDEIKHTTEFVYLTSEDHKLVRMDIEDDFEEPDTPASDVFWNMNGKLNYLKEMLSEGYGKDEATSMANDTYDGVVDPEDTSPIISYMTVTTYQTGDACEPIELPADAAELTWEQWQNGEYEF